MYDTDRPASNSATQPATTCGYCAKPTTNTRYCPDTNCQWLDAANENSWREPVARWSCASCHGDTAAGTVFCDQNCADIFRFLAAPPKAWGWTA